MNSIIKAFGRGFIRGAAKSIDIGNTYKPRSTKRLRHGQNITESWIDVGASIRKSMKKVDSVSR